MTGDEMERAIDFLLKSQANLEAEDRRLRATIEEVDQRLGARIEDTNRQLAEYANMQTMFIQVVTRTFAAQAKFNKRTDERLNALMDMVDKMLGGGQGGKP